MSQRKSLLPLQVSRPRYTLTEMKKNRHIQRIPGHSNVRSGELTYKTWVHMPPKVAGPCPPRRTLSLSCGCAILALGLAALSASRGAHNRPLFKRGSQFWAQLCAPRPRLLLPGIEGVLQLRFGQACCLGSGILFQIYFSSFRSTVSVRVVSQFLAPLLLPDLKISRREPLLGVE
jgi:hypothetical protein